jgi:glycosyltransferase involved in cell wall biosynthesis
MTMTDPMRLCIVAKERIERCPPLLRMLRFLLQQGHQASVFCVGGEGKIPDLPGRLSRQVASEAVKNASGLVKCVKPIREISRLVRALRQSPYGDQWDLVVAYDPYALLACHRAGLADQLPVVYYSAELWDQRKHWPQRWAQRASRPSVDAIIACQDDRLRILRDSLDLQGPGLVVPNSCYDYLPHLRKRYDHPRKADVPMIFAYQGSSNVHNRCLAETIEAFGDIDADVRLRMQLVGSRANQQRIDQLIERTRHPEHFEMLGYRPYPEHFAASYSADAAVMFYRADVSMNYRYCAPNKLYEYPMLSLPVLSSNQPHLRSVIEGQGLGICVDPTSPHAIREGIARMLDASSRRAMARRARKWFTAKGRYELAGARLERWLARLAGVGKSLRRAG